MNINCRNPQHHLSSFSWALEPAQGAKCLRCGQGLMGEQGCAKHNPKTLCISVTRWLPSSSTQKVKSFLIIAHHTETDKDNRPGSATLKTQCELLPTLHFYDCF